MKSVDFFRVHDIEALAGRLFEPLHRQRIRMQFFPSADNSLEHGILRRDKFDHRVTPGEFRSLREHVVEGNPFADEKVMQNRQHEQSIEPPPVLLRPRGSA